ncbi:MAG: hypothetical protein QM817_23985 [Archangium sp.]
MGCGNPACPGLYRLPHPSRECRCLAIEVSQEDEMGGLDEVERLAAEQWGVVARWQAKQKVSRATIQHQLDSQRWLVKHRGVYRFPGSTQNWHQDARALTLLAGEGAVISHATAGWLHRLDGIIIRLDEDPRVIHVTAPNERRVGFPTPHVVHRSRTAIPQTTIDGLPVTTMARTLIDLADLVSDDLLEHALDSARRKNKSADVEILNAIALAEHRGRRNIPALLRLMKLRLHSVDSPLEVEAVRRIRAAGLPEPTLGYSFYDADGHFVIKADAAWLTPIKVALHCDSRTWHKGAQLDRDAMQRTRLEEMGVKNVMMTWATLDHPFWVRALRKYLQS